MSLEPPITENGLLTRAALAKHLMVSVSTVDRMLADGEITPIRLRGKLVRFHLADVLEELRGEGADVEARVYAEDLKGLNRGIE